MARNTELARDVAGFLLLDKPSGITSNRALQKAKRLFNARKAGHTGSLDPLATGMLPICLGAATKLSAFVLQAEKAYEVAARLGIRTDTDDADGRVIEELPTKNVERAALESVLQDFTGVLTQVPPMYSALKHDGRRLYELARKGIEVEREARSITVREIELLSFEAPDFRLRVRCSKGTYIRTLVTDLAERLGTIGHVQALRRIGVHPFWDEKMTDFGELESAALRGQATLDALLLPIDRVLADWPSITLDPDSARRIREGQKLALSPSVAQGQYRLYVEPDEFVGIGEYRPGEGLVPRRIFL